tara:strand:+ start:534 stop:947 length:414 start_codon:yes stop_codon:yes gene_type:complete
MKIRFVIKGEPIAQKRHRHHRFGVYDPSSKDKTYISTVIHSHIPQVKLKGAIVLHIDFYCKRPKYHFGTGKNKDKIKKKYQNIYKLTKPDIDNYIKFYMDCFNDKIWEDDSQVINISSSKRYSNSEPKTEVHIYQLN